MSDNLQTGQLKQVIRSEFLKCAKSPAYFMKKYCQIQHPMRGKIPFSLYDYQERVIIFIDFILKWIQEKLNIELDIVQIEESINNLPSDCPIST